jgi:hypothetical protein
MGLAVIGAPLLLVIVLGLVAGPSGGDGSDSAASAGHSAPFDSDSTADSGDDGGTADWSAPPWTPPQPATTAPYTDPGATDWSDTAGSDGTSGTDDTTVGDSGAAQPWDLSGTPSTDAGPGGTATSATTAPTEPAAVVTAYFKAINDQDYRTAWNLGGKNLTADYTTFVSGFRTIRHDTVKGLSVQDTSVSLTLNALQTDGTTRSYRVVYAVADGLITDEEAVPTT